MKRIILVLLCAFLLHTIDGVAQTCPASENFSNLPTASSASYTSRSWTGTNGFTWTALGARTDQTMTGAAICFGNSPTTRSVTSPSYSDGIGTLTFNYVRAFTGTSGRTIQVWVNGTQIGSDITVNATSDVVQNYSQAINISGNIVVEIRSTGTSQVKLDNIAWTCYCTNAGITSATADDNTLCPAQTASLTANGVVGTNAVLTWWTGTGGTGTNLGSSNPLTGVGAGTYYARVTAGCGSAVEASVSITDVACSVDADFTVSSTTVCIGNSITFTNATTGASGSATYAWDFGSGASPATASGIGPHTVTYSTAGTATVVLTVTDGVTNTETKTNYITITALPTTSAGSAVAAICQGATTAALGGSFGGSATSAIWSDGGAGGTFANNTGSTPGTATYTASASAPSTVTLTLTTSGGGCGTATDSKTLTVNSVPTAPVLNGGVTPQITNVNNTDFLANWAASVGATGYYLDVATSPSFSLGGTFATEGFNNSMTLFAGSPSYYTGNSASGDRPASTPWANEGTHAAGITNGSVTLTSNIIDASSYSGVSFSFRLASWSISSTGNGADAGDNVLVEISPNGGTTYYSTLRVEGNGNAYWGYAATGVASTSYDGDNTPFVIFPSGGGNRTTDGYSTVTITNIPNVSTLRIRITLLNNATGERWTIDNFTLSGSGSTYVPGYENLAVGGLSQSVTGLSEEATYYYRVRAINDCGSSANSSVVSVTTTCSAPTTAASAVNVSTVSSTSLSLGWTSGNGVSRIIVARAGAAPTGTPSNLTTYTANADITLATALGDGFVVYNGTGNSATITGLTPGTQYFFTIYEYNCGATREQYLITGAPTGNNYTLPSNVTLTELCTDNSTHQLSWTFGTGSYDGILIFARQGATSSGPGVSDVTTYTGANANYTLAADYAAKGKLVYAGSGTSVTITGLISGLNYTFSAFTYKNNTSTKWSTGTSASQTIVLTDVTLANAAPENQQVNVGWTNPTTGCYDEILVVANAGAVVFTPTGDGTAYTANAAYSAANQVVYKGTSTGVTATSLSNGTNYCFKIFVRKGTEWSLGSEVCATPNTSTEFGPGDLAIVAVNTQVLGSGSTDEVCFVAFKEITAGTSFFMTDNGFERATAHKWGDSEGVMRFTRAAGTSTIPAGTVICLNGPYTTEPYYDIIVCGVLDNDNWQIDANVINAPSGASSFDLNSSDQVWIMQGGAWSNPSGSQNATYNGNLLYGWSGITWKANIGTTPTTWTTAGSRLIPGTECFTTELSTVTNNSKTKYTGPVTSTTRLGWIARINNASNWTGYSSNANYDAAPAAYDYFYECIVFPIDAPTETAGKWLGSKNTDWFDCANWDTKEVPDSTVNVVIENVSGANNICNIDYNAPNAYLYSNMASCRDLTITDKELRLEGNASDALSVFGDLSIGSNGTLLMSDGTAAADGVIYILGDWNNQLQSHFNEGDGTVHFIGTSAQSISTADTKEVFNNVTFQCPAGMTLNDHVQIKNQFYMSMGTVTNTSALLELGVSTVSPGTLNYFDGRITGEFKRWMTATSTDYLFPIGTSSSNQFAHINCANVTPGAFTLSFKNTAPSTTGLPVYESGFTFNNTFTNGYWSGNASDGLASTEYTLSLDGTGFTGYTQDADVRILQRTGAGSWTLNGTHSAAVGAVANRSTMNAFGEYALAPAVRCITAVSTPSILTQTLCAGEPITNITATPADGEAPFSYQWYVNSSASTIGATSLGAANGAQTITLTPSNNLVGTNYYFLEITQAGSACPPVVSAFSQVIITPQTTYYRDQDGDGYGNALNTIQSCSPVAGYILNNTDCNDANEDVNPGADEWCNGVDDNCAGGIDEGLGTATFYYDNDNDGYGDPLNPVTACVQPVGTVTNNTDCNDALFAVNPAATEICDGINNDCDAFIDEGCGPINDERNNALPLTLNNYSSSNCQLTNGTLFGAQISAESQSTVVTGEDVWYYFVAPDGGISIQCASIQNNILLELQTENGVVLDTENVQSTIGNETLNYGLLTPGETYLLCVRNYNSAQGTGGSFSICARVLYNTACFEDNYTLSLCSQFKVDFTGGAQFIYHFGSGITYSGVYSAPPALPASTRIVLNTVPGLMHNTVFPQVWIDAVYALTDGAGNADLTTVVGIDTCQLTILPHADLDLRALDQNIIPTQQNTKPMNSFIGCTPYVCGVTSYDWSFRKVDLTGAPTALDSIVINSGVASGYLRLNATNIPGIQPGDRFRVKIRPRLLMAGNPTPVPGDWGTDFQYVRVTPPAGMTLESPDLSYDLVLFEKEMAGDDFADLYPNPNKGDRIMLNTVNTQSGITMLKIFDATGKQIWAEQHVTEAGLFSTEITPQKALSAGLYLVEIILNNNQLVSQKLVVQ